MGGAGIPQSVHSLVGRVVPTNKPPNKQANPLRNMSEKSIRKIWTELKPQIMLERLRSLQPAGKWSGSGYQLLGCCPYHGETTPSFRVYLDRGYAKCFGCEQFVWNPVSFWATIQNSTQSEALKNLQEMFGLKFLNTAATKQLRDWERNQLLKKRISDICHDELIEAIQNPADPHYAAAQVTIKYLFEGGRELPRDTVHMLHMLGIVPPLARMMAKLDTEEAIENSRRETEALKIGETKFEKFTSLSEEAHKYMTAAAGNVGSIIFTLHVAPDTIGRFKIRRPGNIPHNQAITFLDDAYEEDLGFLGLGWNMYRGMLGAQQLKYNWPYIVEGEFDALSVMARQLQAGSPNFIILSAGGGSGCQNIDNLKNFGFDEVYLVGDSPAGGGERVVDMWLPRIKQLRSKIFIGWDKFPRGKDPDEIVVLNGLQVFQQAILDVKNRALFQTPQEWVFDGVREELDNIDETDLRHRIEVAASHGQHLKNPIECGYYVELCAKTYGLPEAILKREIVAREEDEPAFILRIAEVLSDIFAVVGQQGGDSERKLVLWHKEKRIIKQISLADDNSAERELGTVLGPAYLFFNERIGIPDFLAVPDSAKASGAYLQKDDKGYRWYLRQALLILAQSAPDFDNTVHMAQGIHVIRGTDAAPTAVYLVNGRDVYHGVFDVAHKLTWHAIDGPSHNKLIFEVGFKKLEEAWIPFVTSVDSLNRAEKLNPLDLWERLHHVIDIGWRFKNHAITVDFLTAHLLATTICNAFRRQSIIAFHADTRSGKSKMVRGLIGGQEEPRIHLIAAAVDMGGKYSAASVRQRMRDSTRPLCLDEFEDEGTNEQKARAVSEILETFRGLTGETNAVFQGSRGGEYVYWKLTFPLFVAAINKVRKVQDANRMVTIYMERQDHHQGPVAILLNELGSDAIYQLKQDLAIGLLPHISKIQVAYEDLETEYAKAGTKPTAIDNRVFDSLFPALATMKYLGKDYHKFISDYCEANKEGHAATIGHTDSSSLYNWIVESPRLKLRIGEHHDRNDASLLQLLVTPELREEINVSGSGLYWDETQQVLVVNWTSAIQTVLAGNFKYGRETNVYNLRELANRAPNAMSPKDLEASGILQRLRNHGLAGVSLSHLTAYRMAQIIQSMNPASTPTTTTIKQPSVHLAVVKKEDNGSFDG